MSPSISTMVKPESTALPSSSFVMSCIPSVRPRPDAFNDIWLSCPSTLLNLEISVPGRLTDSTVTGVGTKIVEPGGANGSGSGWKEPLVIVILLLKVRLSTSPEVRLRLTLVTVVPSGIPEPATNIPCINESRKSLSKPETSRLVEPLVVNT